MKTSKNNKYWNTVSGLYQEAILVKPSKKQQKKTQQLLTDTENRGYQEAILVKTSKILETTAIIEIQKVDDTKKQY